MDGSRRLRGLLRVLVLVGLIGALLPALPAAADVPEGQYFSLSTAPVTVTRGGQRYSMTINAYAVGSSFRSASMTLSQTKDPKGVKRSTQSHTYSFDINETGSFDGQQNLSTASFDTGSDMGGFGSIALSFAQNASTKVLCKNASGVHSAQRAGTIKGKVSLKTGTKRFGEIKERPGRATLFWSDFQPCGGGGGNTFPCSSASRGLSVGRNDGMNIWASRTDGASSSAVSVSWWNKLGKQANNGSFNHYVNATLPAKNVVLGNDLKSGTIRGSKGTWLSGVGSFKSSGALQKSTATCGKNKKYTSMNRPGALRAGSTAFKVTSWLGAGKTLKSGAANGGAFRRTAAR